MATATVTGLKAKSDAAFANIGKQLHGMEAYLDKSDAPGEWTTRQVLCHLLFEPGWDVVGLLKSFSKSNLPLVEIKGGDSDTSGTRATATAKQLLDALDAQRKAVFAYLDGLSDVDLQRKARIPLFKQLMGNEEVPIPVYVGALFDYHWNDHAGQLAKIRKAVGLPEAR
jgi:DinB superfamily